MIKRESLYSINSNLFNHPNIDSILDIIYDNFNNYRNIEEIDNHYNTTITNPSYYYDTIRPILSQLFIKKEYFIQLDKNEDYDSDLLTLNESQKQVLNYYENNGVKSGIICHATGTGKTNCLFLTIGYKDPDIVFIFCYYKNILKQMFYDSNDIDYDKFRKLKKSNLFDLWKYEIYDLSNEKTRNNIIKNIDYIKSNSNKKIFIINPQYIYKKYEILPIPELIIHDECHSITGSNCYNFLKYFREKNSIIIGLSATPIRNIKSNHNYQIIREIYSENIISSYENIKAIINNDILNIEIYWFESQLDDLAVNNKLNKFNQNNCINKIRELSNILPNNKILVWCGTIQHANNIYKKIKKELSDIYNNNIFLDHSGNDIIDDTYLIFKPLEKNAIMICADKYREGSDIEYLDCVVFADLVKKKSELPFIQCIGRVQRKGYNKTVGCVIDHYNTCSNTEIKSKDIVDKLIGYYYELFTNIDNSAYKMYNDILNKYIFEQNNNIVMIKLTDELSIKIHTGLNDINFTNIRNNFKNVLLEHINETYKLEVDEQLRIEYNAFRDLNNSFLLIEDKTEYKNKIDEYNLEPEPEIKYEKIWTNWYDYLNIDIKIYPETKNDWKDRCIELKIKSYEEYLIKIKNIIDMPKMPEEIYKIRNIIHEFNNV